MKKIKFNESISGYGSFDGSGEATFSYAPEQVAEVGEEIAQAWVASGVASWAPKEVKPVVPKAEFAVAKAPEVTVAPKVTEAAKVVAKPEESEKKEG